MRAGSVRLARAQSRDDHTRRALRGTHVLPLRLHKDIATALERAKADGKLVLLDFGANWCPDCIALSRLFETATVKPFFTENFHLVKINLGRKDQNQDLCAKYDAPVSKGIPAVVVLDAGGSVLAATRGGELANARTATAAARVSRGRALRVTGA